MAVNPQTGPVVKYSQLAIICNPQRNLPSRLSPPQPLLYQPTPGDSGERAGAVTHMVPPWYGRGTTMAPPWYPPGTTMTPPCLRYQPIPSSAFQVPCEDNVGAGILGYVLLVQSLQQIQQPLPPWLKFAQVGSSWHFWYMFGLRPCARKRKCRCNWTPTRLPMADRS